MLSLIKKSILPTFLTLSTPIFSGLIGVGPFIENPVPPLTTYVFQYSESNGITNLNYPISTGTSSLLFSVSENSLGSGLIGGTGGSGGGNKPPPFAFFYSLADGFTTLNLSPVLEGIVNSVSLNNSSIGLIGGLDATAGNPKDAPFAFVYNTSISSSPINLNLSLQVASGTVQSVAINDSGNGLLGGLDQTAAQDAPLAFYYPSGLSPINLNLSSQVATGSVRWVDINSSGNGLIGGVDQTAGISLGAPLAFYYPSGSPALNLNLSSQIATGSVASVSINDSGNGLIGGVDETAGISLGAPLAFYYPSGGPAVNLNLSTAAATGSIVSVSINNSGNGLIGGGETVSGVSSPILFEFSSGVATLKDLSSFTTQGAILTVSINEDGIGLVGGFTGSSTNPAPFALLYSPSGLTSLTINGTGSVFSVSLNSLLSNLNQIPTSNITGNNLILANYINENASNKAYYFLPSELDGTLNQALEAVAPTRNAFSPYSAASNIFFLANTYSGNTNSSRTMRRLLSIASEQSIANLDLNPWNRLNESVIAFHKKRAPEAEPINGEREDELSPVYEEAATTKKEPFQMWGTVLGNVTYEKEQNQTPAFEQKTGGIILGFDKKLTTYGWFGAGAAYTYTDIKQHRKAGHNNINQESLFLNALWDNSHFYLNTALWGGLFQIKNRRNVQITGFDFKSKSSPNGWQVSPYAELGYSYSSSNKLFTVEPFILANWANVWQESFEEKGNNPFNMGQKSSYSSFLLSQAGIRFYQTIDLSNMYLSFLEQPSYIYQKPFGIGSVNAFIVGSPGSFTVTTFTSPQSLGAIDFQMIFQPKRISSVSGSLDYQGKFGEQTQSHVVSVNLFWDF